MNYSLSTHEKSFRKTNISFPLSAHARVRIGSKRRYFFGKFCVRTKLMTPKYFGIKNSIMDDWQDTFI